MEFTYKGKPIMPTKAAMNELSDIGLELHQAAEILEKGFQLRKRKKNITERAVQRRNKIVNVVVVDMGNYYKLIHVGEFTLTKKFKRLMRDKK